MWQSDGDVSLYWQDQQARGIPFVKLVTKEDIYMWQMLVSQSQVEPKTTVNTSVDHLAVQPQHCWPWQVHCPVQPSGPSAASHCVPLQGPSFENSCFMACLYAYTDSWQELSPLYTQKLLNLSLKCSYLYGVLLQLFNYIIGCSEWQV